MGCEVQTDIKFDDIRVGDMIVMEVFSPLGDFIGTRRGTAQVKNYHNHDGGVTSWCFDKMNSLYSDASGVYRLFRVEPPTAAEVELDRLRKIETDLRGYIERHTKLAMTLGGQAVTARSEGNHILGAKLVRDADEIMHTMRRLGKVLGG